VKWFSAASDSGDFDRALESVTRNLLVQLGDRRPDLLVVFASQHHLFHYGRILPHLQKHVHPKILTGCSAGAVIGGGVEIEERPGITLTAAMLPEVHHRLVHLLGEQLPELDGSPRLWRDLIGVDPEVGPQFVVLGDPFSIDLSRLLQGLDYAYPGAPKVGGLASGAHGPGGNALFVDHHTHRSGAVVLALWGNIEVDTIVAQGCRPIGKPVRVTDCDGNLLKEIDGRSPKDFLQELYEELDERDRALARHALFLGVVMNELQEEIGAGDFLIRNILGMHRETGIMAVGAQLRPGQTVQLHLRDGETAAHDLSALLARYRRDAEDPAPAGALLFSCLGRGEALFGEAGHDTRCFREAVAPVPIGGFFCNGEIGPVGGSTYLHGYTSAFGIFRPRRAGSPS
jgi:small ligand-binding sensory domain FIST